MPVLKVQGFRAMNDLHSILRQTDEIGSTMSFSYDGRKGGAACLFDLAHEHAKSIVLLIDNKLMGSAYAFLRPCIEAYIRGDWILHCATEEQVKRYTTRDAQWPKLSQQTKDLEEHLQLPDGFKRYMGKTMGMLDAFTHRLSSQIKRRLNGNHIEIVATEEEKMELAWEASFISLLSHVGMAEISEDDNAANKLELLFEELIKFNK